MAWHARGAQPPIALSGMDESYSLAASLSTHGTGQDRSVGLPQRLSATTLVISLERPSDNCFGGGSETV